MRRVSDNFDGVNLGGAWRRCQIKYKSHTVGAKWNELEVPKEVSKRLQYHERFIIMNGLYDLST